MVNFIDSQYWTSITLCRPKNSNKLSTTMPINKTRHRMTTTSNTISKTMAAITTISSTKTMTMVVVMTITLMATKVMTTMEVDKATISSRICRTTPRIQMTSTTTTSGMIRSTLVEITVRTITTTITTMP